MSDLVGKDLSNLTYLKAYDLTVLCDNYKKNRKKLTKNHHQEMKQISRSAGKQESSRITIKAKLVWYHNS